MPNIEITNNKTRSAVVWDTVFEDAVILAAAAGTIKGGTVLAQDTATAKFAPYVAGGADDGKPLAVLRDDLEVAAAGDIPCRLLMAGRVRAGDLLDAAEAGITPAAVSQLRDFSIIALDTTQLAELDNQ